MRKMFWAVGRFISSIFIIPCPNCESAYTGGCPNPEDRIICICCSDPKTMKMRGWTWRFLPLARHNVAKNLDSMQKFEALIKNYVRMENKARAKGRRGF